MTNYTKGRDFEYRVKKHFQEKGYFVARQARSTFPDLIAVNSEEVLVIECKCTGYLTPAEKTDMISLYKKYGMIPILASKNKKNGRIQLNSLIPSKNI